MPAGQTYRVSLLGARQKKWRRSENRDALPTLQRAMDTAGDSHPSSSHAVAKEVPSWKYASGNSLLGNLQVACDGKGRFVYWRPG
jgi:hypothetical protein